MLAFLDTKSEAARIIAIARLILLKKHKVNTIVPIPRHHQIIDYSKYPEGVSPIVVVVLKY